jgi:iron complex outermembrane receptor protein
MMKQVKFKLPLRNLAIAASLFLSATAFAQSGAVKGQVKDATGEPIIGATITANGKAVGVTDFDGNYSINVPKGTEITISYVGMSSKKVTASDNLVITLKDDNKTLNEVVVIGYGTAKKNDLTGSVTAIKPDAMNHGLQTNATDMMQGKIAGVNVTSKGGVPGSGATIRVRGGSSLNASNDPLIVIDGLAMDSYGVKGLSNPLSMVNPNDIESFTVLKDASATAIYGSRASNGVIIITTKKGRKGQKPQVSYSGNVSVSTKKKTLEVMDGPAYTEFIKNLYGENSDAYKALGWYDNDGNQHFANTNWQDQIYRTALSTDHNVTVSGGVGNMPYRVSMGYTNSQGIVKTSNFERYTASFNLSPSFLKDHLTFNINAKGMIAKNKYADGGAIGAALYMDPTKPVTADNSIYNNYFGGYTQWYTKAEFGDASWSQTSNRNGTSNPVATLNQKDDHSISRTLIGNIEGNYKVQGLEDLQLHVNAGMDISNGKQTTTWSPYSKENNYYGFYGWTNQKSYNLQLSMYAQYSHDWLGNGTKDAPDHHFDIMGGYEWQHFHNQTDYANWGTYPSTNTLAGQKFNERSTEHGDITLMKTENYLVSFFGRMNYTLLNRYMMTFTLRDDGSSRFNKNNRWGLFPSAALAWRINDEAWLRNVKVINDLKLRLGWGITGQQEGIGDYTYIATYTPNIAHAYYPLLGDGTTYRPDVYNPNLTWEKTTTWNAGLDLSLLNNRLGFSVDYYYRKTKDLINSVFVSAGGNFGNKMTSNVGSLHNSGIEFATTVRPIVTKDFSWEMNYNITYNKNKVDELLTGSGSNYYVDSKMVVSLSVQAVM